MRTAKVDFGSIAFKLEDLLTALGENVETNDAAGEAEGAGARLATPLP